MQAINILRSQAEDCRKRAAELEHQALELEQSETPQEGAGGSWAERFWEVPSSTRIGVHQAAEALGRSASWVYKHTSEATGLPLIPFRRVGENAKRGRLEFIVGELRSWISQMSMVGQAGVFDSVAESSYRQLKRSNRGRKNG